MRVFLSNWVSMDTLSLLTLPAFCFMFAAIYLLGYTTIFRNWPGVSRPEASSCLLSLAHGTPAVLLATFSLHPETPSNFASPNTPFQNIVLEYSMAYFCTDLLHYLLFIPNDLLFIAHHLATIYVFFTCRYIISQGAIPILVLLALAEVTSACQNTWRLAWFRRVDSQVAARVHELLSPLFYGFYSVVRGMLGPVVVYKMVVFYSRGGGDGVNVIPKWAWVSWLVVIVSAIFLSMLWVLNLWLGLWIELTISRKPNGARTNRTFGDGYFPISHLLDAGTIKGVKYPVGDGLTTSMPEYPNPSPMSSEPDIL